MPRTLQLLTDYSDVDLDAIFAHVYPKQQLEAGSLIGAKGPSPFQRMGQLFARWTGAAGGGGAGGAAGTLLAPAPPKPSKYTRLGGEEDAEGLMAPVPESASTSQDALPGLHVTGTSDSRLNSGADPAQDRNQDSPHMSGAGARQAAMQARRASWNPGSTAGGGRAAGSSGVPLDANAGVTGSPNTPSRASNGRLSSGRRLSQMLQSAEEVFVNKMLAGMRLGGSRDLRGSQQAEQQAGVRRPSTGQSDARDSGASEAPSLTAGSAGVSTTEFQSDFLGYASSGDELGADNVDASADARESGPNDA